MIEQINGSWSAGITALTPRTSASIGLSDFPYPTTRDNTILGNVL